MVEKNIITKNKEQKLQRMQIEREEQLTLEQQIIEKNKIAREILKKSKMLQKQEEKERWLKVQEERNRRREQKEKEQHEKHLLEQFLANNENKRMQNRKEREINATKILIEEKKMKVNTAQTCGNNHQAAASATNYSNDNNNNNIVNGNVQLHVHTHHYHYTTASPSANEPNDSSRKREKKKRDRIHNPLSEEYHAPTARTTPLTVDDIVATSTIDTLQSANRIFHKTSNATNYTNTTTNVTSSVIHKRRGLHRGSRYGLDLMPSKKKRAAQLTSSKNAVIDTISKYPISNNGGMNASDFINLFCQYSPRSAKNKLNDNSKPRPPARGSQRPPKAISYMNRSIDQRIIIEKKKIKKYRNKFKKLQNREILVKPAWGSSNNNNNNEVKKLYSNNHKKRIHKPLHQPRSYNNIDNGNSNNNKDFIKSPIKLIC